ncbi:RsmB/NOP family class I SAM-dependent RNA methyltransferase [Aestuariibius sp. HNIBRBA575]|uniref:RsmB/NOP family class I SAM-dependent RNA methyltransferase n=1 Tax=Aestuariibius sp. HNIBRBA575 TaxID=3233343 RepID=UPI0034A172F6
MTPAARVAAAIEILDQVIDGQSAERILTGWGRQNRYAGSKDRAAIRDYVYDVLRHMRSYAAMGGDMSGRGLMIGALRANDIDPETMFTAIGHAPSELTDTERNFTAPTLSEGEALDCPDWLLPYFKSGLGADFEPSMRAAQNRAPVFLRVATARGTRQEAMDILAIDQITTQMHPDVDTALEVLENPRRVAQSVAYLDGLVDLQDAASQSISALLPLAEGDHVLDYCAGGGGKALALYDITRRPVHAHDIDAKRMTDIPVRAERAGAQIHTKLKADLGTYDLVLCDAPCTGSGTWRRDPQAKWLLTPDGLTEMTNLQKQVLDDAAPFVKPGGVLAYATCSVFLEENQSVIDTWLSQNPTWTIETQTKTAPSERGDGFFVCVMHHKLG